ncbi:MAG TPA: ArsI/CadI family heavy metal resistance metalloenzyme [Pseudolabrys sp.]|nr:ArsI/CadI family heavy metal resistance metalloenzyme [Pseudolabrys sp.]
MKRMHVHVSVEDIGNAVGFYSALFAAKPAVVKDDYAKWMLEDPRMNFAISTRGRQPGLDHLGIQVESEGELQEVYARLHEAGGNILEEGKTSCCYAQSEKSWIDDPAGIAWETFFTTGASTHYGTSREEGARIAHAKACCGSAEADKPAAETSCCSAAAEASCCTG